MKIKNHDDFPKLDHRSAPSFWAERDWVIDSPPIPRARPGDGRHDQLGNFQTALLGRITPASTTAVRRQHEPQHILGDLLQAEISEKQARSIKYQLSIAKLPLAKDLDDFQFAGTPINETLVNDLAGGGFLAQQRNAVLVGGTGTGKTHLAIAIARSCIRSGATGRFYN